MSLQPLVVVGLSGGVDSAVAAYLLLAQGFRVHGVFMHLWSGDEHEQDNHVNEKQCCSIDGYEDVRRIAYHLGIPLTVLNLSDDFNREVVSPFIASYQQGKTPNPCVTCNRSIKFGRFFERTEALFGSDILHATGHYGRIIIHDGEPHLLRAIDSRKDQSYFLHRIDQAILKKLMLPLGDYLKDDIREIAAAISLPRAEKKESQGVCFIKNSPRDFLTKAIPTPSSGDLVDVDTGAVLGRHKGIHLFTRGQRHGMAIGGGHPYYVLDIVAETQTVLVTMNHLHPDLSSTVVTVDDIHWIHRAVRVGEVVDAQFRYHQTPARATIREISSNQLVVELGTPLRAVMPGQAAVLYRGEEVLGGGVIRDARNPNPKYLLPSKYGTVVAKG